MYTYFIQGGNTVKIGRSTDPEQRVKHLQTSSSVTLRLLCTFTGDREAEFHHRFSQDRIQGEWFTFLPNSDLWNLVANRVEETERDRLAADPLMVDFIDPSPLLQCPCCGDKHSHFQTPRRFIKGDGDPVLEIPVVNECGHRWTMKLFFHGGCATITAVAAQREDYDTAEEYLR